MTQKVSSLFIVLELRYTVESILDRTQSYLVSDSALAICIYLVSPVSVKVTLTALYL